MIGALYAAAIVLGAGDDATLAEKWSRFPVFVWFHGGPPPGPRAFATLERHGLGGCNVEGGEESDAAVAAGVDFYVDHAAGKGDLFLRPETFDADRARLKERLDLEPIRPNCFNDPAVRARLEQRVADSVRRHAGHAPLAWVLDDEISVTRGVNPMDYCFGAECLDGLRAQARAEYGTIAALNAVWSTRFADFAEARPPTTEATRRANAGRPLEQVNFAAWSDHREFMRRSFARTVGELARAVARNGGRGPAGFTGGQFPSAFGGFEGEELLGGCTLAELYESGAAPELARSLLPADGKLVTTLFVPDAPAARAGWSPWELLARAARGDDGVVIWSSGALFRDDGGELNDAGRALAEVAGRAAKRRLFELRARPVAAPVAIFESVASVRATWMLDSWEDGATWPNRLTSYEAGHSSTATSREEWVALLRAASLPFRFAGSSALAAGTLRDEGVRCLVLHEAVALSAAEVEALARFAQAGGSLVADDHALLFDEKLRGRAATAATELLGITRAAGVRLDELGASFGGGERARTRARATFAEKLLPALALHGVVPSPRLAAAAADALRLHRWQVPDEAGGGEIAVVVAGAPAPRPVAGALVFTEAVTIEWLELATVVVPASRRVAAGVELPLAVDELHPAVVRWRRSP